MSATTEIPLRVSFCLDVCQPGTASTSAYAIASLSCDGEFAFRILYDYDAGHGPILRHGEAAEDGAPASVTVLGLTNKTPLPFSDGERNPIVLTLPAEQDVTPLFDVKELRAIGNTILEDLGEYAATMAGLHAERDADIARSLRRA